MTRTLPSFIWGASEFSGWWAQEDNWSGITVLSGEAHIGNNLIINHMPVGYE